MNIKNHTSVGVEDIPLLDYGSFYYLADNALRKPDVHCLAYYAVPLGNKLRFFFALANDIDNTITLASYEVFYDSNKPPHFESLAAKHYPLHIFEREITENYGVKFDNHPWDKPVRYAYDRHDRSKIMDNYPFFAIEGEQSHEVGVGPVHASIIEPGFFKFSCIGENVQHLEIMLGFQHRGIENLYLQKKKLLQRTILSENIAGDTAVGHATTFVTLMETLAATDTTTDAFRRLQYERAIALELERIAMHTADLSNMNVGMAYQLGAAVIGGLRTPIINYFQWWCGNRFGNSLIRTGGTNYALTPKLSDRLRLVFDDYTVRFQEIAAKMFALNSVLGRMENIGTVSKKQATLIGAVGMAARCSGLLRDARMTHPFGAYSEKIFRPDLQSTGDVFARAMLRRVEIEKSMLYIQNLMRDIETMPEPPKPSYEMNLKPNSFAISIVEGWRGEIVHSAITDQNGEIIHYKVKDPSFHNWFALALALRNLEISDFPINNKSFNLSYCGHDL